MDARAAVDLAIAHITKKCGGVTIGGLPELEVTPDAVMALISSPVPRGRIAQVEISSRATPGTEKWFARVGRHELGYAVMLFADPRE